MESLYRVKKLGIQQMLGFHLEDFDWGQVSWGCPAKTNKFVIRGHHKVHGRLFGLLQDMKYLRKLPREFYDLRIQLFINAD